MPLYLGDPGNQPILNSGFSRRVVTATTGLLASSVTENLSVLLGKSFTLLRIETSAAAWVRLYATPEYRTRDASRLITQNATPPHGIISEVITWQKGLVIDLTPIRFGASLEGTPNDQIAVAITNKSISPTSVAALFTVIQEE